MKNITVILPIHKLDEKYETMLINSVESVKQFYNDVKLLIVAPEKLKTKLNKVDLGQKLEIQFKYHKKETDYCTQINTGIETADTEWVSFLEIDDKYLKPWLKNMNQYMIENPDVDVILPIISDVDYEGKFIYYTNESVWAYGFSQTQGVIDNETLMNYENFQISGGLYRKSIFEKYGYLKDNIKLAFGYELFLRLTHNDVKIIVCPKSVYEHMNLREDSLFWLYKNDEQLKLKENEAKFWIETAKKEQFLKIKRDIIINF